MPVAGIKLGRKNKVLPASTKLIREEKNISWPTANDRVLPTSNTLCYAAPTLATNASLHYQMTAPYLLLINAGQGLAQLLTLHACTYLGHYCPYTIIIHGWRFNTSPHMRSPPTFPLKLSRETADNEFQHTLTYCASIVYK